MRNPLKVVQHEPKKLCPLEVVDKAGVALLTLRFIGIPEIQQVRSMR